MTLAREAALTGVSTGYVVTATKQRAGRGRSGAPWASEPGRGLWATIVLWMPPEASAASLSPAMALAVCEGVRSLGVQNACIKWPNDILVQGHKLAGLLLERGETSTQDSFVLCGLGLNLHSPRHMPVPAPGTRPLPPIGLCEAGACKTTTAREALLALLPFVQQAHRRVCEKGFASLAPQFDELHGFQGQRVVAMGAGAQGQDLFGTVDGIEADGTLRLLTPDGPISLVSSTLRLADSSSESHVSGTLVE